ncbi:FAD-binding oxidoreductase [Agrobacterium sp. a22-2]|uniref:NAD(P)/FAD-dependent oxidoreductase n=1 Tax=Agrobacterium sp. a22-2 TaxID=2283840 RepID=UPI001444FB25|nr:FAD-binding oxidoreductase [Agrobacterium sp. a22-2]NKN35010.1 FAD-binding oxidoreductase [Agrobacterium sp. a22-2]
MTKTTDGVTRRKTLRTDHPLWAATPRITVPSSSTPRHQDYDVIIVGAGISGAMMAEALADGKRRILVIDRRLPVRGSTMASTAMIQHEIDIPLHQLDKLIGKEKAARAWQRSSEAVKHLKRTIARLDIRCAFEERCTLYLAGEEYGSRALQTEADRRIEAGLQAEYLKSAELRERFGIQRTAGIVSNPSASANPAQLTAGLHKAAAVRGVETVSLLDITDLRETRDGVVLATAGGRLLTAADVVFCTGYEFLEVMESPAHRVISTWALASEPRIPRPAWLDEFLVWEGSDPYLYFRSTPDGRIIAGGEDEADPVAHLDQDKAKAKFARIAEKLKDLTGIDIGKPAYGWAAAFGTTTTGLPIIDRTPGMDHVHAVMGFGGNGITFSAIASELVASRIAGQPDPEEDLFRYPE